MLAGIVIGAACLWGIALWQDISPRQLLSLFLGSFVLIFGIMLVAFCLIVVIKLITKFIRK